MNIKFDSTPAKNRKIPEVGQMWKIVGVNPIYMRINDRQGAKATNATNHDDSDKFFYSVILNGNHDSNSSIYSMPKNELNNVVIVEPSKTWEVQAI